MPKNTGGGRRPERWAPLESGVNEMAQLLPPLADRFAVTGDQAKSVAEVRALRSPGCCRPVPYARFVNEELVSVAYLHRGKRCAGSMNPMRPADWLRA